MERPPARAQAPLNAGVQRLLTTVSILLVVAALALAKQVFVPLILAVLISFLLAPAMVRLERWRFPRTLALLVVTAIPFSLLGAVSYLLFQQVVEFADHLPEYERNLRQRTESLFGTSENPFQRVRDTIENIVSGKSDGQGREHEPAREPGPTGEPDRAPKDPPPAAPSEEPGGRDSPQEGQQDPIPVTVLPPPTSPIGTIATYLGPLLSPLSSAGIVLVLVIFILLARENLRDRAIYLMGGGDLDVTTQALEDATSRISDYLRMLLFVNVCYAIPITVGLIWIGLPNALLWGVLAMLLRFVPYIGAILGAGLPVLLSLAVFPDWARPLQILAMFVVLDLAVGNFLEPWLYGVRTGISSVAVLVSAIFWTWLWGPIGLLLATPLTVCVATLGRHVPQLRFLHLLLGDEQVLAPQERFYQRLAAYDHDEAEDLAMVAWKDGTLVETFDALLLPSLRLAEDGRYHGSLEESRHASMLASIDAIAAELAERQARRDAEGREAKAGDPAAMTAPRADEAPRVLVVPVADEADAIAGRMFGHLLAQAGFAVEQLPVDVLVSERLARVREADAPLTVLSAVPPGASPHVRYLCKRLERELPDARIVIGFWLRRQRPQSVADEYASANVVEVSTLAAALVETKRQAQGLVQRVAATPAQ